jgi:uncharacterized membrane protein YhaH (DUF805 family)
MKYYLEVLKKYATFSGRARRSEYWYFVLFNFIFMLVAMGLDNLLGTTVSVLPYGYFYFALALAVLIPGLAVFVRRMHDIGKSGWWYFIAFIPLVGAIWLLVLCCTEGVSGDNEYGADPKLEAEI